MLAKGRWVAEKPFRGRAGFWINELYSPFTTWGDMATEFVEVKHDPAKLKVFVNTRLGEGWEDHTTQAETLDLEERREDWGELLPPGVLVMTAATDVQGDRLEAEKVGWGLDEESWSVDYKVFVGDPSQTAVWDELEEWLTEEHEQEVQVSLEGGKTATVRLPLKVACAAIDSGGHHTNEVYAFTRKHAGRRFHAIKGASTPGSPLVTKPTMKGKPPVRLYLIGTDAAKDTLHARLQIAEHGPGFCHFPQQFERDGQLYYDDKYFKQLRSERPVTVYTKKGKTRVWEKLKASARNEGLDLKVYNMAALKILNANLKKLAKRRFASAVESARAAAEAAALVEPDAPDAGDEEIGVEAPAPEEVKAEEQSQPRPAKRPRRRGGWATNW